MTWFFFVIIVGLGGYRLISYYQKVKRYYKVTGTIIGHDVKTTEDALMGTKYFYAPIVEFTDKYLRHQKMVGGEENPDRPLYKNGDTITLLVHPDDSSRFIVYDFVTNILIPLIWITIGVAIPLIPILFPETFKE